MELVAQFFNHIRAGSTIQEAADRLGVSRVSGRRWMSHRGGVLPRPDYAHLTRSLSFSEREYIAELRNQGHGVRTIAARLHRAPSTISRELRRVTTTRPKPYRASTAQAHADAARTRPKPSKLATNPVLAHRVQGMLTSNLSPEQISGRLKTLYPDRQEMWVSHETIYQALYVQTRGGLTRELTQHLRTGRSMRKPRRKSDERRGRIPGMINIADRPAEVADRAVPGHWEGDLILGSVASGSAIGTLVERTTGFVMLLHLPDGHSADQVAAAMITKIGQLSERLKRSVTWDQGSEMARHARITAATGVDIYFCDPHSPWQRGTNENTNGLLRQYFPKGTDLSFWGAGYLDMVADELNARPRKRHGFLTPAEVLTQLLNTDHKTGVATTT